MIYTSYDPDLVLERHGHSSDHVIFILKGSLSVGGTECPPGTMVLLPHGAAFGPLIAGPEGTELIEFYTGEVTPVPADPPPTTPCSRSGASSPSRPRSTAPGTEPAGP